MKAEHESNTKFKIGPIEVTFNAKDGERFKLIVIVLIILFVLGVIWIIKVYVIPLLLVNGTGNFFSKMLIKITAAFKYFKGIK